MWLQSGRRDALSSGRVTRMIVMSLVLGVLPFAGTALLQGGFVAHDPGVRGGGAAAGGPLPGLTAQQINYFSAGQDQFSEVQSVTGTIAGEGGGGLGPRFNSNSCGSCHAQPALGGSSPSTNPQVAVATVDGATNAVPFFITLDGPVREARFKYKAYGKRDGGVHALFTIAGRTDAPGCSITQPDFDAAAALNNLSLRIPTPVFGAGLIEAIPDAAIIANQKSNLAAKLLVGISGRANRSDNDGTVTRVGWKAQNKSLQIFAAEAYNVEMGVTNELFGNERDETPGCLFNGIPEDYTDVDATDTEEVVSDTEKFALYTRFLAPPAPAPDTPSIVNGRALFGTIGCALCHTPALTTKMSSNPALSSKAANLYSDLLVHHMGPNLADDIIQGQAGPDDFRTAPLWGLGQRIFFLHDGRTNDLLQAIEAHASAGNFRFPSSEANTVIAIFNHLSENQKQDILNFLRAL